MFIRILDKSTDYFNYPFSLKKAVKVEAVQVISMNTKLNNNTDSNNTHKHNNDDGFAEVLKNELKKYR